MAAAVYALCTLTCLLCAVLLLRQYRRAGSRLLFWSSLSFAGWTLSNALVFIDLIIVPEIDLSLPRTVTACVAVSLLLYGLLWDTD